ncbi:MAG: hypothetical protein Q9203_002108 [Teloschistes exilis]
MSSIRDSIRSTLTYIFYNLVREPTQLQKLQRELDAVSDISGFVALQQLTYLNGIIIETLRLHPVTLTGSIRETPAEGAMISGRFVPGNIKICAPRYTIGRPSQKWLDVVLRRYTCIGKNLAPQELRYAAAQLVCN